KHEVVRLALTEIGDESAEHLVGLTEAVTAAQDAQVEPGSKALVQPVLRVPGGVVGDADVDIAAMGKAKRLASSGAHEKNCFHKSGLSGGGAYNVPHRRDQVARSRPGSASAIPARVYIHAEGRLRQREKGNRRRPGGQPSQGGPRRRGRGPRSG